VPKALVVSSVFPPLGSAGGSIRLVKLLKYMSLSNWQFVVYTQDLEDTIVPEQTLSAFLLNEIPNNIEIKRVSAPFAVNRELNQESFLKSITGKLFRKVVGHSAIPWGLRVLWNGLIQMRKSKIDIVFATAPPYTNVLIGMLASWLGGKPFVLDLRDDWVGSSSFYQKSALTQKAETFLEKMIVREASAVITVTPHSFALYKERYAYLNMPEKFHLVPNGCDLEEFEYLENREKHISSDCFLILSAAWWYQKKHRDITPFLFSIHRLLEKRPDINGKIALVLLGNSLSSEYDSMLTDLRLEKVIHRLDAVGRKELLDWLWKADLLMLLQPIGNTTAISGSLYEYWATGKAPILLISEEGASSALVKDHQIGQHFHHDQINAIADYVESLYDAYSSGKPIWIERDGIQNFDRKFLAEKMNNIWKNLLVEE
jgi:glycosyltransferase involved in cell wall biosynthesis